MGFGGPPSARDSGRSQFKPDSEEALGRHYHVLKDFLSASLRDEKGNIKPNKARDKLLRLSVTQFMELSTDVYDELIRREDERAQRVPNVPRSLPPKQNFHPKRNQARQKLSTLPVERFRQLATDVFYELERRIPRFAGSEIDRPISSASSNPGGPRAPSRGGMRPPPNSMRGPPPPGPPNGRPPMAPGSGPNGMGPPQAPYQSYRPASSGSGGPSPGTRPPTGGSDTSNFGRPLPKTFQSNTIVPNKSTMVEDDDNDEDEQVHEDAFGLSKALSGISNERSSKSPNSVLGNAEDKEKIKAQEAELAELKARLDKVEGMVLDKEQELESLKGALLEKGNELERVKSSGQDREEVLGEERNEWYSLREELEQKHFDARQLNENLQRELDLHKQNKSQDEHDVRAQHEQELEELRTQLSDSHEQMVSGLQAQLDDANGQTNELHRQLEFFGAESEEMRRQLDDVHDQTSDLHRQLQTHQAENRDLRQQLQSAQQLHQTTSNNSEHERRIQLLREELENQERLTNDVRDEAMLYLQEMRDLSRQNDYAIEAEEKLAARVSQLERKIEEWRRRYAKVKAQNKSLRASTMGLGLQTSFDSGSLVRKEGLVHEGGLVRDVDVTRFQLAVDELLKVARKADTEPMLDSVKSVVVCVQSISSAVGTDGYPTPSPSPLGPADSQRRQQSVDSVARLKARVTGTANSLITATKQHVSASGLSPVALLDAAASNLTASVVELIKAVGIRPSPKSELHSDIDDEEAMDLPTAHEHMSSFYDDRMSPQPSPAPTGPLGGGSLDSHLGMPVHSPSSPLTLGQGDGNGGGFSHSRSPSVQVSSPAETPKPAPLNVGRNGTPKKTNGWFGGWGRKVSVDEMEPLPPSTPTAVEGNGRREGEVEEYDPYR